jgi:hypothetical protein
MVDTFLTWVLLSFVHSFLVFSEITLFSCMVVAFTAWALLVFIYRLLVLSETAMPGGHIPYMISSSHHVLCAGVE